MRITLLAGSQARCFDRREGARDRLCADPEILRDRLMCLDDAEAG
jgi:hypothetical protein